MRRIVRALTGLVLALAAFNTSASLWICSLTEDIVHLICVAEPDLVDPVVLRPRTAVMRGVSYPLDPEQTYLIDLWTPPNEVAMLEMLAQSSICHRSPECMVMVVIDDSYWALNPSGRPLRVARVNPVAQH